MRFRTIALALALTLGCTVMAEARKKTYVTRVKNHKFKAPRKGKFKARKFKAPKQKIRR